MPSSRVLFLWKFCYSVRYRLMNLKRCLVRGTWCHNLTRCVGWELQYEIRMQSTCLSCWSVNVQRYVSNPNSRLAVSISGSMLTARRPGLFFSMSYNRDAVTNVGPIRYSPVLSYLKWQFIFFYKHYAPLKHKFHLGTTYLSTWMVDTPNKICLSIYDLFFGSSVRIFERNNHFTSVCGCIWSWRCLPDQLVCLTPKEPI